MGNCFTNRRRCDVLHVSEQRGSQHFLIRHAGETFILEKNSVDKIYFYYDTGETVLHIYDGHVESKKFLQNWTREAQAELENFSIVHAKDFFYINNN